MIYDRRRRVLDLSQRILAKMTSDEREEYARSQAIRPGDASVKDKPPKFTEAQTAHALEQAGVTNKCPACGATSHSSVRSMNVHLNTMPEETVQVLILTCPKCGFIRQFDNAVLKVESLP